LSASSDTVHAAPAPSLAEEVAAIKAAKSALLAGNASDALHQLDAYRAHFPHGRLTQEASVVRIEALLKAGKRDAASAAGDRFLAAHADSPYAARVHTLIGH
jgi:outer membrane protein assembly factor BamD (BamD/ComL family)